MTNKTTTTTTATSSGTIKMLSEAQYLPWMSEWKTHSPVCCCCCWCVVFCEFSSRLVCVRHTGTLLYLRCVVRCAFLVAHRDKRAFFCLISSWAFMWGVTHNLFPSTFFRFQFISLYILMLFIYAWFFCVVQPSLTIQFGVCLLVWPSHCSISAALVVITVQANDHKTNRAMCKMLKSHHQTYEEQQAQWENRKKYDYNNSSNNNHNNYTNRLKWAQTFTLFSIYSFAMQAQSDRPDNGIGKISIKNEKIIKDL